MGAAGRAESAPLGTPLTNIVRLWTAPNAPAPCSPFIVLVGKNDRVVSDMPIELDSDAAASEFAANPTDFAVNAPL